MDHLNWKHTFPNVPESFHDKVNATLMHLPEGKEQNHMSRRSSFTWKKGIVAAAAATLVLGTTVFAGGKIVSLTTSGSSSSDPTYQEVPTAQQMERELGVVPTLPGSFANGYVFQQATIMNTKGLDEDGNVMSKYKELSVIYEKQGKRVNLYTSPVQESEDQEHGQDIAYQGVIMEYSTYINQCVPADYEMTQEDQKAAESGEIVFSYGSDEVEIDTVQSLEWEVGEVSYLLQTTDTEVTQEDLTEMAQEMIDAK